MFLQIAEFRDRVQHDMKRLVAELQALTRRYSFEETQAWQASLPAISRAFSDASFANLDLYFGENGRLALEYRMPAANHWADMVLLGKHNGKRSAVIVELKNLITRGAQPGPIESLMVRHGVSENHPSDQVRGYSEYIRRFHSAVEQNDAAVHGCVVFTKDEYYQSYELAPNDRLVSRYPCFSTGTHDVKHRLPQYFGTVLTEPDRDFANAFERGVYSQSRGFIQHIGEQILNREGSPFVLLGEQRTAFAVVNACVSNSTLGNKLPPKTVIIVEGPPGSGKSVVAASVWASLASNAHLPEGSVVVTTTSASQSSNWQYLFELATNDPGAAGVVKKATSYTPLTTGEFGEIREQFPNAFRDAGEWEHNMRLLRSLKPNFRSGSQDEEYLVSIVDEAHALINPEHVEGRGQHGFTVALGPQAYHIMRTSVVSVFFLDANQGFRSQENTTIDDLRRWARLAGVADNNFKQLSLEDGQFRCAGSKDYVDWVERLFDFKPVVAKQESSAESRANPFAPFTVEFCRSPHQMESELRARSDERTTVRLLATYARKWKTKGVANPHILPAHLMDFALAGEQTDQQSVWSKIWNFVPGGSDYTHFIQAPLGSQMASDPLAEVGCPYAVRGFDFDYVGLLWLSDLKWRGNRWIVDPSNVWETGITRLKSAAEREVLQDGPAHALLLEAVKQAYRIVLTRAMKGLLIWCEDDETRAYLETSVRNA